MPLNTASVANCKTDGRHINTVSSMVVVVVEEEEEEEDASTAMTDQLCTDTGLIQIILVPPGPPRVRLGAALVTMKASRTTSWVKS